MERGNLTVPAGLVLLATLLVVCLVSGCRSSGGVEAPEEKQEHEPARLLTRQELGDRLTRFGEAFSLIVQNATDSILEECSAAETRRKVVLYKTRAIRGLESVLVQREPRAAFIDAWTYCVQLLHFFEDGPGADELGHWSEVAVKGCQQALVEIEFLGREFLTDEQFADAQGDIVAFARENPMSDAYTRRGKRPSEAATGSGGYNLSWILDKPLAPFQPLKGIDEGAAAIREFSWVAEQFAVIARTLPEKTRWEAELMLYDVSRSPTVESLQSSFDTVARSSSDMVTVAEKLPQRLRLEFDRALNDLDARQGEIQNTLRETRLAVQEAEKTLAQADQTATTLQATARELAAAGEAWTEMFNVIDGWVQDGREQSPSQTSAADDDDDHGYDIRDYESTARAVAEAARELRTAIAELDALGQSSTVDEVLAEVNKQRNETVIETRDAMNEVVDHVAWRALQLLGAACLAVFLFRAFGRRARAAVASPSSTAVSNAGDDSTRR